MAIAIGGSAAAQPLSLESVASAAAEAKQQSVELPVRVVGPKGAPIANAKVAPWALRSSQGHGWWRIGDKAAHLDPQDVVTDAAGLTTVLYPKYRNLSEGIRTIAVSLQIDHPDFAYVDDIHIDVPLEISGPHVIELAAGVPLEVRPTIDGAATDLDTVFVEWSDGRSYKPGVAPKHLPDGVLQIPAMPPGKNSILLVKLDGDRATHFSKITDVELVPGDRKRIDVPLRPSVRIAGRLSDDVPRPVREGRLKTWTLDPADAAENRVSWSSWAPIEPNGTFTVDGWPADEPMQLIALCEGYSAASGRAPDCVKDPPDLAKDPFARPQVFNTDHGGQIEVAMTQLARCAVQVVDEDDKPVAGVTVVTWPNVGWWNSGSQIYCHPLARGERLLRTRDYFGSIEEAFAAPFRGETDAEGKVTLELPAGHERLELRSEVYELPVFLGERDVRVKLSRGEVTDVVLRVQPNGTEKLGEWDKLAGVVFGCSTREGRRICALPAVQKQMEQFTQRFRAGKNQNDPQLLFEAYSFVADAFVDVGDAAEAANWRKKADEQAAKAKLSGQIPAKPAVQ